MNLDGKTLVVTGGASGIGAATAALLQRNGATVIGVYRNVPAVFSGTYILGDLSTPEGVAAVAGRVALVDVAVPRDVDPGVGDLPGVTLLDARAPAEYRGFEGNTRRLGHIPGATPIEWSELLTADGKFKSPEELKKLFASDAFGAGRKGDVFREESKRFFVNYLKQVAQVFNAAWAGRSAGVGGVAGRPVRSGISDSTATGRASATVAAIRSSG